MLEPDRQRYSRCLYAVRPMLQFQISLLRLWANSLEC